MAKLNTLPIEILSQIWTLVHFREIESFSLTCRIVRNAGAARIAEHLARKKRYSVLHIPAKSEVNRQGHHRISSRNKDDFLVGVLCQIFEEPILAEYVEHLVVDRLLISFSQECNQDGFLDAQQSRYELTENKLSLVAAIIDTCPYLVNVQKDIRGAKSSNEWIRDIEAGGEEALLGLLLYLLCHVQTLRFEQGTLHVHQLAFHMISRIAHDGKASSLCKLRRLEMIFFLRHHQSLTNIVRAAALPSLESLRLEGLDEGAHRSATFPQRISNVKELILQDYRSRGAFPKDFFNIFRSLETFILSPCNKPGDFAPHRFIGALLASARYSLKHLVLHARCHPRTWMGSLHNFRTLRSVHTDWQLLIKEVDQNSKDQLAKSLPPSIQSLHLKVDPTFNTTRTNLEMLSHLVAVRRDQLPSLADLKLVHIEAEVASSVLQQQFVKEAEDQGLFITCDTSADPDVALIAAHRALMAAQRVSEKNRQLSLAGRLAGSYHWL